MFEFRLAGKCKICKIHNINETLFSVIHDLRFKENLSLEKIQDYVNTQGDYQVNLVNLSTHFNKHIPVELKAKYHMQVQKQEVRKVSEENAVSTAVKEKVDEVVDSKIDLYTELEKMYVTLKQRFDTFDKFNYIVDGQVGPILSPLSLDGYQMFTKELRSCIVELTKMKQSEQLIKFLIETVMKNYTLGTLQGIYKELEELRNTLRFYVKDQHTVTNIIDMTKESINGHFSESSKSALQTVKEYLN